MGKADILSRILPNHEVFQDYQPKKGVFPRCRLGVDVHRAKPTLTLTAQ